VDNNPDGGSVAALRRARKSSPLVVASTDRWPDDLERVMILLAKVIYGMIWRN
jgi:hypothetical protein